MLLSFTSARATVYDIELQEIGFGDYASPVSKVQGIVVNHSDVAINSFVVSVSVDHNSFSETVSGLNVLSGASYLFSLSNNIHFSSTGNHSIKIWTSLPNGLPDANTPGDTLFANPFVLRIIPDKKVLLEEANGTWSGYCPDGDLNAQLDVDSFDNKVFAVAYHSSDGMQTPQGDAITDFFNVPGWPMAMVDRFLFPGQYSVFLDRPWFSKTADRLNDIVPADVVLSGYQYNAYTNQMDVTVTTNFYGADSGNFILSLIITEDSITGYPQSNYYDSNPNSPFYGLGDPIPGYAHNHVARDIVYAPASLIPYNIPSNGGTYSNQFSYTIPAAWNVDHLHLIGIIAHQLDDWTNSEIINCNTLDEAVPVVAVNHSNISNIAVYPNPMTDFVMILPKGEWSNDARIDVYDATGICRCKIEDADFSNGNHFVAWNGNDDAGQPLPQGIYFLKISDKIHSSIVPLIKR